MSTPAIMKISPQGQIRIPQKILINFGIEKGDYVEVAVENSQIVLKQGKLIDPSQGWYWTKKWQHKEAVVDREVDKKQLSAKLESVEQGLQWLKK